MTINLNHTYFKKMKNKNLPLPNSLVCLAKLLTTASTVSFKIRLAFRSSSGISEFGDTWIFDGAAVNVTLWRRWLAVGGGGGGGGAGGKIFCIVCCIVPNDV